VHARARRRRRVLTGVLGSRTRFCAEMRVLIVEDERDFAVTIAAVLRRCGMAVDVAADGHEALRKAAAGEYEVIVLDRNLPVLSGDEVCRRLIAARQPARILMLTARDSIRDRVGGLDIGADDYVPKPVSMAELVARVRALGRRHGDRVEPVLRCGDIELDPARRRIMRAGREVALSAKEFAVLEELLRAGGKPVSADRLLTRVWDDVHRDPFENTVRVTVARLRRKLGEPTPIATVIGSGYRCG
jgi:DNA-binding response OmpR family regulator